MRVLHFPSDRAVGTLWRMPERDGQRPEELAECLGDVVVADDDRLELEWADDAPDLSPLLALSPDDIWRFTLPKCWEGDCHALAFVGHLTGLHEFSDRACLDEGCR